MKKLLRVLGLMSLMVLCGCFEDKGAILAQCKISALKLDLRWSEEGEFLLNCMRAKGFELKTCNVPDPVSMAECYK